MELIYVWIGDLYKIKNSNFLLNGEFKVDWQFEKSKLNVEFIGEKLPKDFFGSNISNINALVGENGSGKSTFLHFLFYWISNNSVPQLLIFRKYSEGKPVLELYFKDNENTIIRDFKSDTCELNLNQKDLSMEILDSCLFHRLFISNGLSIRPFHKPHLGLDVSTTNRLYNFEQHNKIPKGASAYSSEYARFVLSEMQQQIEFIENLPKGFSFDFDNLFDSVGVHFYDRENKTDFSQVPVHWKISRYILDKLNNLPKSEGDKRRWIKGDLLLKSIMLLFVLERESDSIRSKYETVDKLFPSNENNTDGIESYFNSVLSVLGDFEFKLLVEFIIKHIKSEVCKASTNTSEQKIDNLSYHLTFFQFELRRNVAKELLNLNIQKPEWKDFVQFHWNLSSGENAILSFYSRLFHANLNLIKETEDHLRSHNGSKVPQKKNLMLLIDEGELYYHPQWQKEFVGLLVEYLPILFPDYRIQVIITVHTPISLSDIPGNNIVFLEKDEMRNSKVDSSKTKETFGSNIFSLLEDSFFLKDGFVGTFAANKIKGVVNVIKKRLNATSEDVKEAEQIIALIGDDLLRDNLQSQLHKSDPYEQIEELRKRNKELEDENKELKDNKKQ